MSVVLSLALIFLLDGLQQGLTGVGTGLLAIPLLCLVLDIKMAVPFCVLSIIIITLVLMMDFR